MGGQAMKRDQRLHRWPKVSQKKDQFEISGKILSPAKMVLIYEFVYSPLKTLWKLTIVACIFDVILEKFYGRSFLAFHLDLDRIRLLAIIGLLPMLLLIEISSRFLVLRTLFGKRIRIAFSEQEVIVKGFLWDHKYSRISGVSFAATPLVDSQHPIYRNSHSFELILSEVRAVRIAEVFDLRAASKLSANCNFINVHSQQNQERDIDPRYAI